MVDLMVARQYRGQGLAPVLIRYASVEMRRSGIGNLYTWVWHSHRASYRTFEKAGWRQIAWVLELRCAGGRLPLRVSWPVLSALFRKLK